MDEDQDTELVDSAMDMGGREFRYGRGMIQKWSEVDVNLVFGHSYRF